MDKRFLAILGGIIIILIGVFAISQNSNNPGTKTSGGGNNGNQPTSHIEGQGKAGVTLIEYGDYQCSVCGAYYQSVKTAVGQLNDKIYFQFRNLPLTSIHPNAFAAARAAEAAGLQGKFWQMHDLLYDQNVSYVDSNGTINTWINANNPLDDFVSYAQQLDLNSAQFKTDYSSEKVNNSINADMAAFNKTGQEEATPTFFLDGKNIPNSELSDSNGPSATKLMAVIDAEINKTSETKSSQ